MRPSRILVLTAVLSLAGPMSVLPAQVASAESPSTAVLVPSNNATVSGTQVILDASASSGVTQVQFELTGGSLSDSVIATATLTEYGWIASWDSQTVYDGTYTLQSVATEDGSSTTSAGISITTSNGTPNVSILIPSNGATLSGTQVIAVSASPGASVSLLAATGTPGPCKTLGPTSGGMCSIGDATLTYYGWLIDWDTNDVADGDYYLLAFATYPSGQGNDAQYSVSVDNPLPTVVVPANDSTVSGSQWLDCTIPSETTSPVQFWLVDADQDPAQLLGSATSTEYGWLYDWDTTSVADGEYTLYCTATYPGEGAGAGASISVTVAN
jgi:hypothetical protein